ncbi:PorP/SprF family type IX secretion system membrane protein [Chitinophaga tropicalis]|uniref:Type IX secretion system membrane protein PorP/SprF n=1 Tax=Chitinophaga tropicalis TaxID=2683588 RepID=A0A7K1U8T6_9BACT|nr:type IX secretion system membrane protein PorP/SprF [Chitinophaga tropicalis]MVT10708.1 type IX secretion system membrane protein PorP/SprF [Chitinophaga tropicalis]
MNKTIIFCLGICCAANCTAQQKPHYTQYILNQYIVNPALSGIENYVDIKLSHRHQWSGLNGAPVTTYFTIQGPIGKKDYHTTATSFAVPGENPRGQRYWENYTAPEPHHGIGLQVINDVAGPLNNFSAYGTYAYHIGLSPRTSLSAGFGAGISRFSLKSSSLDFGNTTVDPAVYSSGAVNTTKFDMMAGLYLYSADYFVGLSAQQIVPSRLDFSDHTITTGAGKTVPHIFVTTGYRFLLNEDFNLLPSVMVKYINPLPIQIEGNVKLQYRDLIWIGGSYRYKDSFAGMMGVNISNKVNLGYSYDNSTGTLNNYNKGSHELVLGFIIGNKYDDSCPRNVW